MTLTASQNIMDLPNAENTREDYWNCRVVVSYDCSVMPSLACHTYPVHAAVKDVSDGPTRFPEAITYDEYVVHPNPAFNVIRRTLERQGYATTYRKVQLGRPKRQVLLTEAETLVLNLQAHPLAPRAAARAYRRFPSRSDRYRYL